MHQAMPTVSIDDWTWVSEAWTRDWLARDTETGREIQARDRLLRLVDRPSNLPPRRYGIHRLLLQLRGGQRLHGVVDFKDYSLNWKSGTRDFERGQQDHITPTTGRPTPPSATHRGVTSSTTPSSRPSSSYTSSSTSSARTATCCSTSGPAPTAPSPMRSAPLARDGRMAQSEWRGHLCNNAMEDLRRRAYTGERRRLSRHGSKTVHRRGFSLHRERRHRLRNWHGLPYRRQSGHPRAWDRARRLVDLHRQCASCSAPQTKSAGPRPPTRST